MTDKLLNREGSITRTAAVVTTYFCLLLLLVKGSLDSSYGSELHLRNISISDFESAQSFRTIQLKCPNDNSGILQQIRKDEKGRIAKTRYKYESGNITKIIDEIADPGKGFQVVGTYKLDDSATKEEKREALRLIKQVRPFSDNICMNLDKKSLYELIIAINHAQLRVIEYDKTADAKSIFDETSAKRVTIGIRCPQNKDIGILEHVTVDAAGYFGRSRFIYQDGKFTHVLTEAARPGGAWQIEEALYLNQMTSPKEISYRTRIYEVAMPMIDNYCQNPENSEKIDIKINQYRREHKKILIGSKLSDIDWLKAEIK